MKKDNRWVIPFTITVVLSSVIGIILALLRETIGRF